MWTIISKVLLQIIISIISDKVLVEGAKKMVVKAVDSKVNKVGVTNDDARDIIHSITESGLNTLTKEIIKTIV